MIFVKASHCVSHTPEDTTVACKGGSLAADRKDNVGKGIQEAEKRCGSPIVLRIPASSHKRRMKCEELARYS